MSSALGKWDQQNAFKLSQTFTFIFQSNAKFASVLCDYRTKLTACEMHDKSDINIVLGFRIAAEDFHIKNMQW